MAYSWLVLMLILSFWGYYLGRVCADHGKKPRLFGLGFGVVMTVFSFAIRYYPEYEYHLLSWDSYAYIRDGFSLPWIFLMLGAAKADIRRAEAYPLRAFLLILISITVYNYRWGLGFVDYSHLKGQRDDNGICLNTYSETRSAAAAATLLNKLGFPVTEGNMARASLTRSREGADVIGVANALKQTLVGTECSVRVERLDFDKLANEPAPSIVYLREPMQGFWPIASYEPVVFFGKSDDGQSVFLGSPRKGFVSVRIEDFIELWNGLAVIIDRPDYIVPGESFSTWA